MSGEGVSSKYGEPCSPVGVIEKERVCKDSIFGCCDGQARRKDGLIGIAGTTVQLKFEERLFIHFLPDLMKISKPVALASLAILNVLWTAHVEATPPPVPPPCPASLMKKTIPELAKLVAEPSKTDVWWMRGCASETLGKKGKTAIPVLLKLMSASDNGTRRLAIKAIGEMGAGASSAVPHLIRALENGRSSGLDDANEEMIESALIQIGPAAKAAIPFLMKKSLLGTLEAFSAVDALGELGKYDSKTVVPHLIRIMNQDNGNAFIAAKSLGAIGKPAISAVPHLIRRLNAAIDERKYDHLDHYIQQLMKIEDHKRLVPLLVPMLGEPQTAIPAANGLAEIGRPAVVAVPLLIQGLNDKKVTDAVRKSFVTALIKIDRNSTPVLEQLLIEATDHRSNEARQALAETRPLPERFATRLQAALEKDPTDQRLSQAIKHTLGQ